MSEDPDSSFQSLCQSALGSLMGVLAIGVPAFVILFL